MFINSQCQAGSWSLGSESKELTAIELKAGEVEECSTIGSLVKCGNAVYWISEELRLVKLDLSEMNMKKWNKVSKIFS